MGSLGAGFRVFGCLGVRLYLDPKRILKNGRGPLEGAQQVTMLLTIGVHVRSKKAFVHANCAGERDRGLSARISQ